MDANATYNGFQEDFLKAFKIFRIFDTRFLNRIVWMFHSNASSLNRSAIRKKTKQKP